VQCFKGNFTHQIHLQRNSETSITLKIDACNVRFQMQDLLAAYETETRRYVEFIGDNCAVTIIDHIDSAYHETRGDPFVASCILGST
jgi:hypothetical protein